MQKSSKNKYYIQNVNGVYLFWSNRDGWVDFNSADSFTQKEKDTFNAPIDGEWVDFYFTYDF